MLTRATTGPETTVKDAPLLRPDAVSTTTFPLCAPAGTVQVMEVSLQEETAAFFSL